VSSSVGAGHEWGKRASKRTEMSNERAERWLRSLGYEPQPEPAWIDEGQRPDFYCPGEHPLWVEVKTFNPTVEQREMGLALEDLQRRCAQAGGLTGSIYVMLGAAYEQLAGRWLLGQLRTVAREEGFTHTFVVPVDVDDYSATVSIRYESVEGPILQTSVALESGKYSFHPGMEPQNWGARATMMRAGVWDEGPELYDLFESDNSLLSVAWYPANEQLHVGATMMPFSRNTTDQRIRAAVKEANRQIRNGQKYRNAPGVCVIYHDTLDHSGEYSVATALFGDLLIPVGGSLDQHVVGRGGA